VEEIGIDKSGSSDQLAPRFRHVAWNVFLARVVDMPP
jgi:hypothetical protein